jgi:oligopeptide/dipeptide ABC transporter ATP-binding protein
MTSASIPSLLSVEGLRVSTSGPRRTSILTGVNLEVSESEIVGIVGESGSGKSTLARAIIRLLPSTLTVVGGTARLRGKDILSCRPSSVHRIRPGGIAMVFQSPINALNPVMPIGKQVSEAFRYLGLRGRRARDQSVEMLERMGIRDAGRRLADYPHQFSGGQRQRIVITIALAAKPSVLFADEPTSALDVTTQAAILDLFASIARDEGMAIVFISHNYAVVSRLCARMLVLYSGQVMETGPAGTLLTQPRHPYTQGLIRSLPSLDQRADALHVIPGCPFHPRCEHAQDACRIGTVSLREVAPAHATACLRAADIWQLPQLGAQPDPAPARPAGDAEPAKASRGDPDPVSLAWRPDGRPGTV